MVGSAQTAKRTSLSVWVTFYFLKAAQLCGLELFAEHTGFLTTKDTKITKDFKDKEFPCLSDVFSGNNVFLKNLSRTQVNMLFLCDLRALCG